MHNFAQLNCGLSVDFYDTVHLVNHSNRVSKQQ